MYVERQWAGDIDGCQCGLCKIGSDLGNVLLIGPFLSQCFPSFKAAAAVVQYLN